MQNSAHTALTVRSRFLVAAAILLLTLPLTGCRICASGEDIAYPSYGGAWQRTQRDSGRVGSLFDPGGARLSQLVARESPVTQDELERGRRDAGSQEEDRRSFEEDMRDDDSTDDDSQSDDSAEKEGDRPDLKLDEEDFDPEMRRRIEKLRDQELDDVKIIPGDAMPPLLR